MIRKYIDASFSMLPRRSLAFTFHTSLYKMTILRLLIMIMSLFSDNPM